MAFDFDSLEVPEGKTLDFKVIYSGCSGAVAKTGDLAISVEAGEAHIAAVAAEKGAEIKAFLREQAIIYAVAN